MPLPIPSPVQTLMAAKDYEFHTTLDIILGNSVAVHIATSILEGVTTDNFGSVDYVDDLRDSSTLNESLTLAVNRLDLRAQNVDGVLGKVLGAVQALEGADAILSHVFIDDNDNMTQVEFLHGEISNAADMDPDIGFQLVSYLTTDGPIGGNRTLQSACAARYKISQYCNTLSSLGLGCTKLLEGPNGCIEHLAAARIVNPAAPDNRASYLGFPTTVKPLPGTPPAGPTGLVDNRDDFNSYFKDRTALGQYTGRWSIPRYQNI